VPVKAKQARVKRIDENIYIEPTDKSELLKLVNKLYASQSHLDLV